MPVRIQAWITIVREGRRRCGTFSGSLTLRVDIALRRCANISSFG